MVIFGRQWKLRLLSVGFLIALSVSGGPLLSGCATGCLLAHGMPDEAEEFRDVKLSDNTYEIILPYTEMVKCVKHRVPPGGIARTRANNLCPGGFKTLVNGRLRPSEGPVAEELVWQIACKGN